MGIAKWHALILADFLTNFDRLSRIYLYNFEMICKVGNYLEQATKTV